MGKLEPKITEAEIRQKISELADQINRDYAQKNLLVVGILRGAFIFMADLVRELKVPVQLDFMSVSSYGAATSSTGVVRIIKDLDESISGRHVLLVEDIIDSGLTLKYLSEHLLRRNPASLRVCALLDKPERRRVDFQADYTGFVIPDYFAVGYGLDYNQKFRNLPGIFLYHPDEDESEAMVENMEGGAVVEEG